MLELGTVGSSKNFLFLGGTLCQNMAQLVPLKLMVVPIVEAQWFQKGNNYFEKKLDYAFRTVLRLYKTA